MTRRTRSTVALAGVLAALLALAVAPAQAAEPAPPPPLDLATLERWMTGSFASAEQALADTAFEDERLHVAPFWTARGDGPWLYVEQAPAAMPGRPDRQRVCRLSALPDGRFEGACYELPGALRFAGAWRDPARLDALTPDSLVARPGCSVFLRPGEASFLGETAGHDCPSDRGGAAYATRELTIDARTIRSWDRGYDASGRPVWGSEVGPYRFERVEQEPPPVVAYGESVLVALPSDERRAQLGDPAFTCMGGATLGFAFPVGADSVGIYETAKGNLKIVPLGDGPRPGFRLVWGPHTPVGVIGGARAADGALLLLRDRATLDPQVAGTGARYEILRFAGGDTAWVTVAGLNPGFLPDWNQRYSFSGAWLARAADGSIVLLNPACGHVVADSTGAIVADRRGDVCDLGALRVPGVERPAWTSAGPRYRWRAEPVEPRALERLAADGSVEARLPWPARDGECAFDERSNPLGLPDGSLLRLRMVNGDFVIARVR